MRLRLTVRRHRLPDTLVIWAIDTTSNPTIYHLLQEVNDTIPIESDGQWGLDDYAVEVKGSTGVNYECLHFQHLASVIKDEDEVIIRPLLSQDVKIRRVSGRVQISADGRHLVDGVPWGRPLLRKAGDRPAVNIPPRKRQRIAYDEDDEDPEGFQALKEKEAEDSEPENNRQLVLHADFEDDDEEDDDDFAPQDDEDAEEDVEEDDISDEDMEQNNEQEEEVENEEDPPIESGFSGDAADDANEPALADVTDQATRAQIRKLHSAFPRSPLAVCKYVFNGSEDIGEAYEAMARGLIPEKPKSAITEISQGAHEEQLSLPETRSKSKTPSVHEPEHPDSMEVEPDEHALIDYYDQNGLPPGSIKSGKALSVMAEALKSSPIRPRADPRRSASVTSNKSVRFATDASFSKGLTSTPFIDKESQVEDEESTEDSDDESSESDESDDSSSEDSSSSDGDTEELKRSSDGTSSSESDTDSSSDSSSDDDESPEEASTKQESTVPAAIITKAPSPPRVNKAEAQSRVSAGQGKRQTHARNARRRDANRLDRFVTKGILPAGTELADFQKLDVEETTPAETVLAALEEVKAAKILKQASEQKRPSSSQDPEFERRRQELLASLAAGGVGVDSNFSKKINPSPPAESGHVIEMTEREESGGDILQPQQVTEAQPRAELQDSADLQRELSDNVELPQPVESQIEIAPQAAANPAVVSSHSAAHSSTLAKNGVTEVEMANTSIAPERKAVETSSTSPKQPLSSADSNPPGSSRRARLDLGAGKRLLFGALGIKAPKTKKDEERVRNDLMKGVRPLIPSKPTEESLSDPVAETPDEEPDAWRLKINYRAVECVQDEVTLSEPPFPFKQRWDHQQQVSYKGDRGGKRKHDQRDQSQYYHDNPRASKKQKRRKGKHNYAEEQEYLDASYEPSYHDDTQVSQFDDSTQNEQLQSDDVEGEVNQQLMNETAEASQGPEDLVSLPDDPSSLPDLKDGQAEIRMIIAFKQWVMSESTKWQPQISAYRTAIVLDITDGGELQLNLAMRDRVQSNKRYDPQTGERIYSKFEVPDDNEMDEDDIEGELILPFSDLIEPKIVEEPPVNSGGDTAIDEESQPQGITNCDTITLSHNEEPTADAEAQFSHVTETPLNSDAAEPYHFAEKKTHASAETQVNGSAREPATPSAESQLQESMVDAQAETIVDDIPTANDSVLRSNTPSPEDLVEENMVEAPGEGLDESIPPSNNVLFEPNTPSAEAQASHITAIDQVAEHVSEEGRQKWTHLMREGGFHSSVPSSLTKLVRLEGMTSPDGLDKLAQDMEMSEASLSRPYSPKFNGFGSSPTRKPRDASTSPEKHANGDSAQLPQSSWETVDNDMNEDELVTSPPVIIEQAQDAIASCAASATSEVSGPGVDTKESVPPVSKAMQEWLIRKQARKTSAKVSEAESSKTSPILGPEFGLNGVDERELMANVKYPELSIGSSFTSQITDHGHQPDFNFEDSLDLSADTPKGPGSDFGEPSHHLQLHELPEAARLSPLNEGNEPKAVHGATSDSENDEPELPPRRTVTKINSAQLTSPEILEDDPSSEDLLLPTIEEMASSQRPLKREHGAPAQGAKKDDRHKKTIDPFDEDSEDDQTMPKASQKRRSLSGNRKVRTLEKPESQRRAQVPRASQPRPSQSQPQASQIVDLTVSSDVEAESESEPETKKAFRQPSRRYSDNDDEFYEDEGETATGWMPKKASSTRGGTRRHTSVGLRPSSQASLNTQNRKKTSAR